jgi:hypothetical protein
MTLGITTPRIMTFGKTINKTQHSIITLSIMELVTECFYAVSQI